MSERRILVLATEQQAYAFDLDETFRIALGRHESNDIQLASRTVSNYHAEILNDGESLVLHDLRSANGTHVNDERVSRKRLEPGDRIRIGNYVLVVQLKARASRWERLRMDGKDSLGVGTRGRILSGGGDERSRSTLPSSSFQDVSLTDLLVILAGNRRSALVLLSNGAETAKIYIDRGRIVHAECGETRAEKALYRSMTWAEGEYEVAALPEPSGIPKSITLPPDTLIMEGMQQREGLRSFIAQLPDLKQPLRLNEDCALPLCALTPAEVEVLQSIIRHRTPERVMEASPLTDFRVLALIQSLLRKKVFESGEGSASMLEPTTSFQAGRTPDARG